MKKIIFCIIAAAVSSAACAQIQFGVKAGLNLAKFSVSPSQSGTSFGFQPSFNAGGLVYIPLLSSFGLQPEVMYSVEGSKISFSGGSGHYNMGYINIPVLFKYQDHSGFFAEIGPQLGLLLSAKAKSGGTSTDFKDQVKSTDFSGVLGIGFLSSLNLGIDARYNLGFVNIAKDASDGSIKNGVIQVSVFYLFGQKKK